MRTTNIKLTKWLISGVLALLLVLLCTVALADVEINETNFPDDNFRAYVLTLSDGGNILTNAKISTVTEIDCSDSDITNLKGIEYFTALKKLSYYENQLTALDVSKNTALTWLECWDNQLTSLDVSKNTALTELNCGGNQLTSLDVSKNTSLTRLDCHYNQLTTLDVSKNTALTNLLCDYNELTELDLNNNTALKSLNCSYNQLTALDVSKNTALTVLRCEDNKLTELDLSNNTALTRLSCYSNQLTTLDVSHCTIINQLVIEKQPEEYDTYYYWKDDSSVYDVYVLAVGKNVKIITTEGTYGGSETVSVANITLNKTKGTLAFTVSEQTPTLTLVPTITPVDATDTSVTWQSSDPEVATVDENGVVTGLKLGTATITCEAKDGGGAKATCEVTVKNQTVDKITLSKTKETLTRTGKAKTPTLQLKATLKNQDALNTAVTWTSDKPKIAKVDQTGKVTALKAGTAKITCTAQDGSATATCTVTVKDAKVTKITLSKTKATLKVSKTLQLKVKKFTPASPLNTKVKWNTSNKKIAKVDKNGKVTAVKAGTCEIKCTAQDGSKVYAVCKITVK